MKALFSLDLIPKNQITGLLPSQEIRSEYAKKGRIPSEGWGPEILRMTREA